MLDRIIAITVARAPKTSTLTRVTLSSCRSESLLPDNGLIRFSDTIEAGARIAELVVLIIADSNEPKNIT